MKRYRLWPGWRAPRARVDINNSAPLDIAGPFGGFRQSGNGREWGDHAFGGFLETKAMLRDDAQVA